VVACIENYYLYLANKKRLDFILDGKPIDDFKTNSNSMLQISINNNNGLPLVAPIT
jgi:hypothetical protein